MDTKALFDAVVNGEEEAVVAGVQAALAEGQAPEAILNGTLIPAMREVGRLFEIKEYYIPEMLLAANSMQAGVAVLQPLLASAGAPPAGRVTMGTVKGDLHDIGKNLVILMLQGAGFQVTDLGVDVPPERFVEAAKDGSQIIGLSAMITTTMPNMEGVIQALQAAGVREQVKVMVGGAPLRQDYADEIGADGFAPDANAAVRVASQLVAALATPA